MPFENHLEEQSSALAQAHQLKLTGFGNIDDDEIGSPFHQNLSIDSSPKLEKPNENNIIYDEANLPNMWSLDYVGLYCQYAAIGLLYGTSGALLSLCFYSYDGSPNLCANVQNISFFAWSFKLFFAILTDSYRPFGMRRKPWMLFGWTMVLVLLLTLTVTATYLTASEWVVFLMMIQFFAMFSDVPADGYSVELGRLEPPYRRGVILSTGQMIRFTFCILAGAIQALFLNGPSTSPDDCHVSFNGCWSFGLTVSQYYGLLFGITFFLTVPIFWLKELDGSKIPMHSFGYFVNEIWDTLQNLTTLYLVIFVIGFHSLAVFRPAVNVYMQYSVIQLTNFQAGIDTMTTFLALSLGIYIFKTYLINRNWRVTQYCSTIGAALLSLVWMLVYYDVGGLRDGWFTIFIDLDQFFVSGITQVLYSVTVIELSKPGLEATTYELIVTVGNAGLQVAGIIGVQMLTPTKAVACSTDDVSSCSSSSVDITSVDAYNDTDGPNRFTRYTLILFAFNVIAAIIFVPFLPSSKEECAEWRAYGEKVGQSKVRGYVALGLCVVTILYAITTASLLISPTTSCLPLVGGSGC